MSNFNGHFIGCGRLEDWAEAVSILEPVYACLVTESEIGAHGIRYDRHIIYCAQPRGEAVHYFRLPVAATQWINDTPLNEDHERRLERARRAFEICLAWLKEYGFTVREASVACPRDYKMLDGEADFLGYDKERGYFRVEKERA